MPNPDYVKKQRMGFYTRGIPKTICLYQRIGDDYIVPYGELRHVLEHSSDYETDNDFTVPPSVFYGYDQYSGFKLFDYQEVAVDKMYKSKFGILQSKAGSGKTEMAIALIRKYSTRTLWITHTKDLLNQSKASAEKHIDKKLIGTITEGKVNIGSGITFATVQTLAKLDLAQYEHMWDVIIVDECHRAIGTPSAVTMFGKVLGSLAARHKYGLSATVHRADGLIRCTFALLGEVVYAVPDSAIADKVMYVWVKPIATNYYYTDDCLNIDGTLNYTATINSIANDKERNQRIMTIASGDLETGHSCIVLSDRLTHLELLMNELPLQFRKYACMISGKMTSKKTRRYENNI